LRGGPAGAALLPHRDARVDEGEALHARPDPEGARRLRGAGALRRAPRVTRRERVLSVPVPRGRGPDDGRGGGVGHLVVRGGPREGTRAARRARIPALP